MTAVLENFFANRFQRPSVFFLGHPISQLAHVFHGQLLHPYPVHAPHNQSQLTILHRYQSAFGCFNAKASRHVHGEVLKFGHLWKAFYWRFEDITAFEPDESESAACARSTCFQMQRKLGLDTRNRDMAADDLFGHCIQCSPRVGKLRRLCASKKPAAARGMEIHFFTVDDSQAYLAARIIHVQPPQAAPLQQHRYNPDSRPTKAPCGHAGRSSMSFRQSPAAIPRE